MPLCRTLVPLFPHNQLVIGPTVPVCDSAVPPYRGSARRRHGGVDLDARRDILLRHGAWHVTFLAGKARAGPASAKRTFVIGTEKVCSPPDKTIILGAQQMAKPALGGRPDPHLARRCTTVPEKTRAGRSQGTLSRRPSPLWRRHLANLIDTVCGIMHQPRPRPKRTSHGIDAGAEG